MNLSHKIALSAAAVLLASGLAAHQVLANGNNDNGPDQLLDRIASSFSLDRTKLQEVADQFRDEKQTEQQAQRQAELEQRLNEFVAKGSITAEQKALILEKHQQLVNERENDMENFKNMSHQERQQAMEKRHQEMKTWLENNGISEEVFMMGPKDGMGQGRGRMGRIPLEIDPTNDATK
ncbi:MAG: hypothetical protein ACOZAN_00675 [Patescibacteria group bacterium]